MSGKQLQAGPTEPLSWGLSRDGVAAAEGAEAAGCRPCPLGLVGSIWKLPAALPHPPCGLWHPRYLQCAGKVKLVPLEAILWPQLVGLGHCI